MCGIPEHFQNTQSFEHDNKVLAFHNKHARNNHTRCISSHAFYVHILLLLRILLFQRKTNAPQRTRVHAVPTDAVVYGRCVPFWNPKPCQREAKGCRRHNFIRHSSKPIKILYAGHCSESPAVTTTDVHSLWFRSGPGLPAVLGQHLIPP